MPLPAPPTACTAPPPRPTTLRPRQHDTAQPVPQAIGNSADALPGPAPGQALVSAEELLALLRFKCSTEGVPATVGTWLPRAQRTSVKNGACVLQALALALADDYTPGSPQHALPWAVTNTPSPFRDAWAIYCGLSQPPAPAHYLLYQDALDQLGNAVQLCPLTEAGRYGFLRQSSACRQQLATARGAQDVHVALNAWINWQWAAIPAAQLDPLMRDGSSTDPSRPLNLAYALDRPSRYAASIRACLAQDVPGMFDVPMTPLDHALPH